jgi:hypothetical protein
VVRVSARGSQLDCERDDRRPVDYCGDPGGVRGPTCYEPDGATSRRTNAMSWSNWCNSPLTSHGGWAISRRAPTVLSSMTSQECRLLGLALCTDRRGSRASPYVANGS